MHPLSLLSSPTVPKEEQYAILSTHKEQCPPGSHVFDTNECRHGPVKDFIAVKFNLQDFLEDIYFFKEWL